MGKLIKQRKESIASYTQCNRLDLAEVEQQECDVILSYLPKQLSAEEIDVYIKHAIKKVSATTVKDMGNVSDFFVAISFFSFPLKIHLNLIIVRAGDG